jgi:hypothetical protein
MLTVKIPVGRTPPDPIERLRHARMVPPAKSKRGPGQVAHPATPQRGVPAGRLRVPGPAWLPELHALDLVAQRLAARAAMSTPVAATPRALPMPEPEPEVLGVRGLLGW